MADEYPYQSDQYPQSNNQSSSDPFIDNNYNSAPQSAPFDQAPAQDFQNAPYTQPGMPPQGYPQQGYPQQNGQIGAKSKIAAGLLGIFLGAFGIHKFYMGWSKEGLIMLLVSLLTCGIGAPIMAIIGLIEGIIYITQDDMSFYQTYEVGQKTWF